METPKGIKKEYATPAIGTDDREAYPEYWYAAQVRSCCERKVAQKLQAAGIESYVPTKTESRQWSDRVKKVAVILIPMIVFVHTSPEKLPELQQLSFIFGFLKAPGHKEPAVIPDKQIESLQLMINSRNDTIEFASQDFRAGDSVTICEGSLKGLSGYIKENSGSKAKIGVVIDLLGSATVEVLKSDIKFTTQ